MVLIGRAGAGQGRGPGPGGAGAGAGAGGGAGSGRGPGEVGRAEAGRGRGVGGAGRCGAGRRRCGARLGPPPLDRAFTSDGSRLTGRGLTSPGRGCQMHHDEAARNMRAGVPSSASPILRDATRRRCRIAGASRVGDVHFAPARRSWRNRIAHESFAAPPGEPGGHRRPHRRRLLHRGRHPGPGLAGPGLAGPGQPQPDGRACRGRQGRGHAHDDRPAPRLVQLRRDDRRLQGQVRPRGQRAHPGRRFG